MGRRKKERCLETVRFAIEIETEFPNTVDSSRLIRKNRVIRGWTMDMDGSLDEGAEYRPLDKNHLYWNDDCIDQIKEIIGLIKAHRGHIRPTCGLHVHIDMKDFSNKEICNIIKAFIKQQNTIYKKFKILKSRSDDMAQKIPKDTISHLTEKNIQKVKENEIQYGQDSQYYNERHWGLNCLSLNKHKSLEWRCWNGSVQIRRIKQYIKYSIEFCLKYAKGEKK